MSAITSGGLGSGLDIQGLVTKLVAAEGQPASARLTTKEANLQADLSALGSLKGALSAFQTSLQGLKEPSAFKVFTATSSNTDLFTVSADSSAVAGSFSIRVDQLAQSAKMRSGNFTSDTALVGAGTLTLGLGASHFAITTDGTTTLAGMRDAINNASDNPGISATIIKVSDTVSQLVLASDKTGAANTITLGGSSHPSLTTLTTVQPAKDALIQVDGQAVTRASNTFSDVISGVTLSLKKADSDPLNAGTLSISSDKDAVKSKVTDFIKAYNSLAGTMSGLSSYNSTTKQAARLFGDATLRGVQNQIRQALANPVEGATGFPTLAEIGIKTNKSGALELDSTKFDRATAANAAAVSQLFASGTGLATRFDNVIKNYLSSDGTLSSRLDGVNKQISSITDQQDKLNTRMAALQTRYLKQFNAMDALVGQLQGTGSYLTQMLDNLPGFTDKSGN